MTQVFVLLAISAILAPMTFEAGAQAQTSDLIGTVGQFGYETGTKGAVANRQIADQLYQQALNDERQAWKSFPPDVGLLAKALQASKDAKAADDQAKEFARAALHGANSGAHAGEFVNKRYGMIDESKLKELSTTSSPYMSQVEKSLGRYGMKLSADKTQLETPFGNFSTNTDDSKLQSLTSSILNKLGYSADSVAKNMEAARRERDIIAKRTMAALERDLNRQKGVGVESQAEAQRAPAEAASVLASAPASTPEAPVSAGPSLEDAEQDLLNRRRALGLQIGLNGEITPIGRKTQDIFQMIHSRYKALSARGELYPR